jgi:membrane protease YdiL (CAAX protease family)
LSDPLSTQRARPPRFRIALIAALVGATVGLLRMSERRAPPAMPSALDAAGDDVLAADLHYRFALFAHDMASRSGVVGVASPSAWEEAAVAEYERLALRPEPSAAACHRLGVIYARRGYPRQAREMLTKAMTRDEGAEEVYWALLAVYSDEPIKPKDVGRLREALLAQPGWLAAWSMAQLSRRIGAPRPARDYESEAQGSIRRFGFAVSLVSLIGTVIIAIALVAALIGALGALLARGRRPLPWPVKLPPLGWVEILDVAALAAFCNALGQVLRDSLAAAVPPYSAADAGLRAGHALLAVIPPLALAIARAGKSPLRWRRALGLESRGTLRHLLQGVMGLGIALVAVLLMRDALLAFLQTTFPGVEPGAVGARALSGPGGPSLLADIAVMIVLAPLVEEILFRGFIFGALLDRLRPLAAAGLSAILFAGAHLAWEPQAFLSLFCLGLVSAYTYLLTRSLWPSILLHAGYNAAILATALLLRM